MQSGNKRIVILGDAKTGKTALLRQSLQGVFAPEYRPTVAIDTEHFDEDESGETVVAVCDTPGSEDFAAYSGCLRKATAAIIVWDITNKKSFERAKEILSKAKRLVESPNCRYVFVGNKLDLDGDRKVSTAEAGQFAQTNNGDYFETSAKGAVSFSAQDGSENHVDIIFGAALTQPGKKVPTIKSALDDLRHQISADFFPDNFQINSLLMAVTRNFLEVAEKKYHSRKKFSEKRSAQLHQLLLDMNELFGALAKLKIATAMTLISASSYQKDDIMLVPRAIKLSDLDKLPITSNSAYLRCKDDDSKLLYVNKKLRLIMEIPVEDMRLLDDLVTRPTDDNPMQKRELILNKPRTLTSHEESIFRVYAPLDSSNCQKDFFRKLNKFSGSLQALEKDPTWKKAIGVACCVLGAFLMIGSVLLALMTKGIMSYPAFLGCMVGYSLIAYGVACFGGLALIGSGAGFLLWKDHDKLAVTEAARAVEEKMKCDVDVAQLLRI